MRTGQQESTMTKTYKIEVDCPNCANKMEGVVAKTAGIASASVNFMTQKMTVEFEDGADARTVMQAALKSCKRVNDDIEIFL